MEYDVLTHLPLLLLFYVYLLAAKLNRVDTLAQLFVTLEVETEVTLDVVDFLTFFVLFVVLIMVIKQNASR